MVKRGFTLIELLLVIAIIGLLSLLITVALANARLKGRDAKRMSDLKQIQTALELYYNDVNDYPATPASGGHIGDVNNICLNQASGWTTVGCTKAYMGLVPTDPSSAPGNPIYYDYVRGNAASSTYSVTMQLEGSVNGLTKTVRLTPAGIQQVP